MNFLKFLSILSTLCVINAVVGETIRSPPVTNHGIWALLQKCPAGTYAKGFQLSTEAPVGQWQDNTSLNGVKFFCGNPTDTETVNITSGHGENGEWGQIFSCGSGYIYGFQLRVEKDGDGMPIATDNTATNNVRVFCTNAEPDEYIEGDGNLWGEWRDDDVMKCPVGQAICGLRTQIELYLALLIDNTSMNNMAAECCELPPPATTSPLLKML